MLQTGDEWLETQSLCRWVKNLYPDTRCESPCGSYSRSASECYMDHVPPSSLLRNGMIAIALSFRRGSGLKPGHLNIQSKIVSLLEFAPLPQREEVMIARLKMRYLPTTWMVATPLSELLPTGATVDTLVFQRFNFVHHRCR